jgi:hypothetical protein
MAAQIQVRREGALKHSNLLIWLVPSLLFMSFKYAAKQPLQCRRIYKDVSL